MSSTEHKSHWEKVYAQKLPTEVSWYQDHLQMSLQFIQRTGVGKLASIIDVGGGASTLVDDLLARGFERLTVLDISSKAIDLAQSRLGFNAGKITWIEADITKVSLPENHYDLWHDRAVFHFLTGTEDRQKYVELVKDSLKPGGHVIIAAFALDGPPRCSGLDVVRYSPDSLLEEFGNDFELIESAGEEHLTPSGVKQRFIYCYLRKVE
ncbi:MAG TPA: class I SAM-dependent methyltransferase [Thermodesulfobacteriota bacterium]|nr:class I SAM-dependent methyltransferase [Thermodesulfobacteriota bacterium]